MMDRFEVEQLLLTLTGGANPAHGDSLTFDRVAGWGFSGSSVTVVADDEILITRYDWIVFTPGYDHNATGGFDPSHVYLDIHLRVGVDVLSYHIKAEGREDGSDFTYEYDINVTSLVDPKDETHRVKSSTDLTLNPTVKAWFENTRPATITVTPYDAVSGAQGAGTAGTADILELASPQEIGVGFSAFDQSGELRTGQGLKVNPIFDISVDLVTGDPLLQMKAVHSFEPVSGSFALDAENGCDQQGTLSGNAELTTISNLIGTEPVSIYVACGSDTLTLTGLAFAGPQLTFTGNCAISFKNLGTGKIIAMGADF